MDPWLCFWAVTVPLIDKDQTPQAKALPGGTHCARRAKSCIVVYLRFKLEGAIPFFGDQVLFPEENRAIPIAEWF
jgi:hypothetical protein